MMFMIHVNHKTIAVTRGMIRNAHPGKDNIPRKDDVNLRQTIITIFRLHKFFTCKYELANVP